MCRFWLDPLKFHGDQCPGSVREYQGERLFDRGWHIRPGFSLKPSKCVIQEYQRLEKEKKPSGQKPRCAKVCLAPTRDGLR